jgi:hypothetical protein
MGKLKIGLLAWRGLANTMPTSQPSHSSSVDSLPSSIHLPLTALAMTGGLLIGVLVYLIRKMLKEQNAPLAKQTDSSKVPRMLKKKVPESDLRLHQRELNNLRNAVRRAEQLDSEKFQNQEFSIFSKIKSYIAHNVNEYTDLNHVVDLLNVAIEAQKSFAAIYQIESQYYSKHQQEFYNFVTELLNREDLSRAKLQQLVVQQAEIVYELLKTDEGKIAIEAYAKEVFKITEHDFGINLLRLFKKNQMSDYALIGGIRESIDRLDNVNLVDLDGLMLMVLEKSHVFEKIGAVLDLKDEANSAQTHRQVLQFIGLKKRYQESYVKFQQLLVSVKEFHHYYQSISGIREQYPPNAYRVPAEFSIDLPGLKLYKKYMAMQDSYQETPVDCLSQMAAEASAQDSEEKKLFKNSWDRNKVAQMVAQR